MPLPRKRRKRPPRTPHTSGSKGSQIKPRSISIIGAGRMGTALGQALRRSDHRIDLVITKHNSTATRAAKAIGGRAKPATAAQLDKSDSLQARLFESQLLLISTPDDRLESVVERLCRLAFTTGKRDKRSPSVALHTSGAHSSEVLAPLRDLGFAVGSLHPLVSIADAATATDAFTGAHFCVEGDRTAIQLGRSLARRLGGHPFTIASDYKPLYHAAAALSSGHVVALIDLAIEMLESCNLTRRRAQQILLPLLKSTVENLQRNPPAHALTGPISRGDVATSQQHLASMKRSGLSEAAAIYSALGKHAVSLLRAEGSKAERLAEITKLFDSRNLPRS